MGISILDKLAAREKSGDSRVLDSLSGRENNTEDTGFLNYLGNISTNIPHLISAQGYENSDPVMNWISDRLYRNSPNERAQIKVIQGQLKQAGMEGGDTWNQLKEDLTPKNFFSKLNSSIQGMGSVGDMIAGLPKSVVGMGVAPFEAASGINLGNQDTSVLSPEERADKIKESAALIISSGVGALAKEGATALIGRNLPADIESASDAILAGIEKVPMGKLARKITIGGSEGLAAGASFGAVSRANREDQLGNMLAAIPFAGLGIGMEMLGIDKIDKKIERGNELFNLRQLQYSPDKSLFEISKDIESLATSEDLARAVINGKISLGKSFVIVKNVKMHKMLDGLDLAKFKESGMGLVQSAVSDDLLVYHKDAFPNEVQARATFTESGFLPNEVVSWKGKDYLMTRDITRDRKIATIKDPTNGRPLTAFISELTRKPDFDLHNPNVILQSDLSLKGQVLADFRNNNPSKSSFYSLGTHDFPFLDENINAANSVQTGKPITFTGLRQDRGQGLPNTGVFYALTLEHLIGYKGTLTGKETIPGISDANLRVRRLAFENPFVFNGKHHSLIKDVTYFYDIHHIGERPFQTGEATLNSSVGKVAPGNMATMDWGKIFTPQEMAAIKEAGSIEKKPVGVGTPRHMANLEKNRIINQAHDDFKAGTINKQQYFEVLDKYEEMGPTIGKTHPESHYAIVDRVVARAMKRNGHDAFIYRSNVHNTEVVDMRSNIAYMDKPKSTVTGLKSNVIDKEKFIDAMYQDFKHDYSLTEPDYNTIAQGGNASQSKSIPWNDVFESFAKDKGIIPEEIPSLKRNFLERLHNENAESLPENEREIYKQAINDNPLPNPTESFENLKRSTNANNMYFDTHDAGTIVLRDRATNKELLRTQNVKEAEEFISKTGQERGTDLDGNRIDPPIFPSTSDNIPQPNEIPELHKAGRLEQFIGWLDSSTEWLTASRAWAGATDVTYGTRLQARIHDPLQVAARQAHTQARPWLERLKDGVEKHLLDMTKEDRAKVSNYLETMTPDQIMQNGIGDRKLNDLEIQAAKQFSDVDITNLFKFRRRIGEIQKQFKRGNPQRQALYDQARQEFGIGSKELDAFKTMSAMRKMPLENASIGNSIRLARSMQDERAGVILDRNLYAAKYMNAKQLAAATAMESLSKDLADKFGIPNDKMLPNYFTHARLYNGGEVSDVLKLFKSNKAADDFYASLIRTGEIDAYERDPIIAMRRYILAGFNHLTLTPAINNASKVLKEELLKVPDAARIKTERVVNQYMQDLRGMPTAADNFTQNAFDTFAKKAGFNINTNIRREWINAILSTITGATQGFRVVQGLRDFYANTRNVYSRLGVARTSRVFELGSNKALQAAYLRDGVIQGYGMLQFATPLEQELGVIGRGAKKIDEGLNRFNQVGMKLSGQPSVFELFQTGVYAEARESVAKISNEIVAGKHGKLDSPDTFRKAYKNIELDAFDRSSQIEFDRLMQTGKYEQAADFLGRQSIAEIIGMYGNANHPAGWNRNIGRIAGQFGMWPTNYRHFLGRLASQGEVGMRAKRLARTAVMDLSLTAVAAKTGISFFTWTALPSVAWAGGPSVDAVKTIYDATVGMGTDQNLAQSRLKSVLPYNSDTDTWNLKHLYIPGSFFADDLAKAYDLAINQNTPSLGLAKGIGLKVEGDSYEAGAIEDYLGEQMGTR